MIRARKIGVVEEVSIFEGPMFQVNLAISSTDIEPQYNHVHHATSLRFLEDARLKLLDHIGCPNDELIAQGLFLVIASIKINYLRELREGPIIVTCEEPAINKREIALRQRILNEKGKTAIDAVVVSSFLSKSLGKAIRPPENFIDAFLSEGSSKIPS